MTQKVIFFFFSTKIDKQNYYNNSGDINEYIRFNTFK